MLLAGNYRCITKEGMRTAKEAVHSNIEESRSVYNFVFDLCVKLGANPSDLVPFEKYAAAAQSLSRPASAARALFNGAPNIERCDKLVQLIAKQKGLSHPVIDANVALVDELLGSQPQEGGGLSRRRRRCSRLASSLGVAVRAISQCRLRYSLPPPRPVRGPAEACEIQTTPGFRPKNVTSGHSRILSVDRGLNRLKRQQMLMFSPCRQASSHV